MSTAPSAAAGSRSAGSAGATPSTPGGSTPSRPAQGGFELRGEQLSETHGGGLRAHLPADRRVHDLVRADPAAAARRGRRATPARSPAALPLPAPVSDASAPGRTTEHRRAADRTGRADTRRLAEARPLRLLHRGRGSHLREAAGREDPRATSPHHRRGLGAAVRQARARGPADGPGPAGARRAASALGRACRRQARSPRRCATRRSRATTASPSSAGPRAGR